jgi:hypothetical protein
MESEPHIDTPNQLASDEQVPAWKRQLTAVTPLSKYLAMALFVLLPFAGFIVGYIHGVQNGPVPGSCPGCSYEAWVEEGESKTDLRHKECVSFNVGGRSGECAQNAPDYCRVVYYPPSCPTCQDGAGCGYASSDREVNVSMPIKIQECESFQYEDSVDLCYLQFAVSRDDSSLCTHIQNADQRSTCIAQLTPEDDMVELYTLGSYPEALRVGEQADVTFTISYAGTEEKATIKLYQINDAGERVVTLGVLADDGVGEDLSAGDYVYSGTFAVGPYDDEQTLQYAAELHWSNEALPPILSDLYKLHVSSLPIEHSRGDIVTVTDPVSGEMIVAGQVLVSFSDTTTSDRAREIAARVEGDVIDVLYLPPSMVLVIQIPGMEATDIYNAIDILETFNEVEYVEPNGVTTIDVPL